MACFSKGHWACGSAILVPILPIRGWWQLFSFRAAVPKGKGTQYTKCMIKLSIQGAHRFRANQHTMSQCSIVRLSLESQQQRKAFGFFSLRPAQSMQRAALEALASVAFGSARPSQRTAIPSSVCVPTLPSEKAKFEKDAKLSEHVSLSKFPSQVLRARLSASSVGKATLCASSRCLSSFSIDPKVPRWRPSDEEKWQ